MNEGTLTSVVGDATKPAQIGHVPIVIPHCCNDRGLWGAGFVIALNNAFGELPMTSYQRWHKAGKWSDKKEKGILVPSPKFELGAVQFVKTTHQIAIANMIGQHGVRGDHPTRPPIRYGALSTAMQAVAKFAKSFKAQIHCPMFGSDLAGGDWKVILQLIEEHWLDNGIDVTVYEFKK